MAGKVGTTTTAAVTALLILESRWKSRLEICQIAGLDESEPEEVLRRPDLKLTGQFVDNLPPLAVWIVDHATPSGPRSAPGISETLIDGTIAAFHFRQCRPESRSCACGKIPASRPRGQIECVRAT